MSRNKNDKIFSGAFSKRIFRRIWWMYEPQLFFSAVIIFCGGAGRFLLLNVNVFIGKVLDVVTSKNRVHLLPEQVSVDSIFLLVRTCLLIWVGALLFNFIFRVFIARIGVAAVSRLYDYLARRMSCVASVFYESQQSGRILSRFSSDYGNLLRMFGGPMGDFLSLSFDFIFMIGLLARIHAVFLIPVIIFFLAQYGLYEWQKQGLRKLRRRAARVRGPVISHFSETIEGSSSIYVYNKQKSFFSYFNKILNLAVQSKTGLVVKTQVFSFTMVGNASLLVVNVGFVGMWAWTQKWISTGDFIVALSFAGLMSAIVQQFFEWISQFEDALAALERIDEYFELPVQYGETFYPDNNVELREQKFVLSLDTNAAAVVGRGGKSECEGRVHERYTSEPSEDATTANNSGRISKRDFYCPAVRVSGLTVTYGSAQFAAIDNVSFAVEKQQKMGIIGRSGSGKSTIMRTIFGEICPSQGIVEVNGFRLASSPDQADFKVTVPLVAYRSQIAYLAQESLLLKGSLRSNLDPYGFYTEADLKKAIEAVGLLKWFKEFCGGNWEAEYNPKQPGLSHGQRQLWGIARILLSQAEVILMDEPTSSVDPHAEAHLSLITNQLLSGKTQIIIAHRLSTIADCQKVIWVDSGKIKMSDHPSIVLPAYQESFTFS